MKVGGDNNGRRGRMLTGKGREQRRRQARADAGGQGTRAGGDNDGRRGRTLTGKGGEQQQRQVRGR